MMVINATFPHQDHIIINNGAPGASFGIFSNGACLENVVPKSPDLVVLEHLPYLEAGEPEGAMLDLETLASCHYGQYVETMPISEHLIII